MNYTQATPVSNKQYIDQNQQYYQRSTSPTINRINILSEKMKQVQHQAELDKNRRRSELESRVRQIDGEIIQNYHQDDAKLRLLNEQFNRITESLQTEQQQLEILDEKKSKEIKLLEKNFSMNVNVEMQDKKEQEQMILKGMDDKLQGYRNDLYKEQKNRENTEEEVIQEIDNRVSNLREQFDNEKQDRDKVSENIIKNFGEEILKFQELLAQEKATREEQHNNLLGMLENLNETLGNELKNENVVRERAEQSMVQLLEDTCNKIEESLLGDQ